MNRLSLLLPGTCLALCGTVAVAQPAPRSANFNPKISLILQGTYADFSSTTAPDVAGVLLGPETGLRPEGFSLAETELVIDSNIDDRFHGWATVALENEDGETVVALEEAYLDTLTMPWGLALKAGRFFSDIGYLNRVHSHAWAFVDLPLVYRALLANPVRDDGVQLRWVAPTDLYFEFGAEALRGQAFPAGGEDRSGARSFSVFSHLGGDLGASHSWRLGVSHLAADANDRRTGDDVATSFSGDSDVRILDLTWKWAPDGNPALTNFVFNAEFFHRIEDGELTFNPDADPAYAGPTPSRYEGTQKGFYLQGVYQFVQRWRAGLRYDRLEADDNEVPNNPAGEFDALLDRSYTPRRASVMVDFSNSEFSRIRVQYNRDETRPGDDADDQFFVQYIMSLGAHPAHQF